MGVPGVGTIEAVFELDLEDLEETLLTAAWENYRGSDEDSLRELRIALEGVRRQIISAFYDHHGLVGGSARFPWEEELEQLIGGLVREAAEACVLPVVSSLPSSCPMCGSATRTDVVFCWICGCNFIASAEEPVVV